MFKKNLLFDCQETYVSQKLKSGLNNSPYLYYDYVFSILFNIKHNNQC